jgi:YVTN family beta-propeller protein
MAVDVERNLLYIGGTASTAIMVVSGSNNEVIDYIERNGNFRRMAFDSTTGRVYAANIDYGTIDVIDIPGDNGGADKHVLVDPIRKSNDDPIIYPQAIDINQKTNRIYVSDGDSSILVIDGENRQILSRIDVGRIPLGIAVNPETNMIYVANFDSDSVSVIDGITGKVILTPASFTYEIIAGVLIAGVIGSIFIMMNRKRSRRKFEST